MYEIEVKARLRDKDGLIARLQEKGCVLSSPIDQEDSVYVRNTGSLETFYANQVFLRIRVQNKNETIFTVKQRGADLASAEHEVIVNSRDELEQILFMLGFQKAVQNKKVRIKGHCDKYEICIDEVDELGTFVEVEKITGDPDFEKIQSEMFVWLSNLGIHPDDRITKGYDVLMIEKNL